MDWTCRETGLRHHPTYGPPLNTRVERQERKAEEHLASDRGNRVEHPPSHKHRFGTPTSFAVLACRAGRKSAA